MRVPSVHVQPPRRPQPPEIVQVARCSYEGKRRTARSVQIAAGLRVPRSVGRGASHLDRRGFVGHFLERPGSVERRIVRFTTTLDRSRNLPDLRAHRRLAVRADTAAGRAHLTPRPQQCWDALADTDETEARTSTMVLRTRLRNLPCYKPKCRIRLRLRPRRSRSWLIASSRASIRCG